MVTLHLLFLSNSFGQECVGCIFASFSANGWSKIERQSAGMSPTFVHAVQVIVLGHEESFDCVRELHLLADSLINKNGIIPPQSNCEARKRISSHGNEDLQVVDVT